MAASSGDMRHVVLSRKTDGDSRRSAERRPSAAGAPWTLEGNSQERIYRPTTATKVILADGAATTSATA